MEFIITFLGDDNEPECIKIERDDFYQVVDWVKNLKHLEVREILSIVKIK